jgi:enamine deaminase RidA (YjgF/YER057c/UK114 family)
MQRKNVYSGTPWEARVAYCRATLVGNVIAVSGTAAVDERGTVVGSNTYEQTRFVLQKIDRALRELGAGLADVVRTRTFLTNIGAFDEFARAHHEAFRGIDPAATCVEVSRLVTPELLVEIEVDAMIDA